MKQNDNKKEKQEALDNAAQTGAASEVVQRYGSASKEHYVAYCGVDNEAGIKLKHGLKSIAQSKIHPNYEDTNIKQQSGYAAELKRTARHNAQNIIEGKKTRLKNTDTKGSGKFNELVDHEVIDQNGKVIGLEQMKFVGKNPKEALNKLASKKFNKYFDEKLDIKITVPSDYYQGIIEEANKAIENFKKQLERAKSASDTKLIQKLQDQIKKYEKIKSQLKDSGVSTLEARDARLHPKLSTAKDIAKISHKAGLEQAKWGAAIGGGVSIIRNLVDVIKGKKDAKDAALEVAGDTSKGAIVAYTTAFTGSAIKGAMQNAKSEATRALAKTNLASLVVVTTLETAKTMKKFIKGEIDGVECLEELGQKGTSMVASAMFATIGQAAIPIPIVGAMAGSMLGYALSSAFYNELRDSLKAAKLARAQRELIEKECEQAIEMIKVYQAELKAAISEYLSTHIAEFDTLFSRMSDAYKLGDIDGFLKNANRLNESLGGKAQFASKEEFNSHIRANKKLIL